MPRRGRSMSPPPAAPRMQQRAPPRTPAPPARPPAASAVPAPAPAAGLQPSGMQQAGQPSLFKQMAATAGGVAVGSTIGHVAGSAITGAFSGGQGGVDQQQQPMASYDQQRPSDTGPCAWEIQQFVACAQNQADLTLCEGFNEALRQCKRVNNMA